MKRDLSDEEFLKRITTMAEAFIEQVSDEFILEEPEDAYELILNYIADDAIKVVFSLESITLFYKGVPERTFDAPTCCLECFANDIKSAARNYSILGSDMPHNPKSKWAAK